MTCMKEIWWGLEFGTLRMSRIKWSALVSKALASLNLMWSGLCWILIQINARFGLSDRLEEHLDHNRMPAGNSREKTKGRSLGFLSEMKGSIVVVKAAICVWLNNNYRYGTGKW